MPQSTDANMSANANANTKVTAYIEKAQRWQAEIIALRELVWLPELHEDFKWGSPCYTWQNANIVLIHTFKDYCALLFFKGALLADPHQLLIQQTENVQAARQIRFTQLAEIHAKAGLVKTYVQAAIAVEKAGLQVERKSTEAFAVPEEFAQALANDTALQEAFKALTPGRQRAYLLHFAAAKQAKTRLARVAQARPQILAGKGLLDK